MFFNIFKKKTPIKVTAIFQNGMAFQTDVNNMKELLKIFYRKPEDRYNYWMEDDIDDEALDGYKITGMTLGDNGKLIAVEFTEQFEGGYNNG